MSRLHVVVRGIVQGVGFRYFVRQEARRLGLGGWVRNRPDGAVEVVAEGEAPELDALRGILASGPRGAVVDRVEDAGEVQGEVHFPFSVL